MKSLQTYNNLLIHLMIVITSQNEFNNNKSYNVHCNKNIEPLLTKEVLLSNTLKCLLKPVQRKLLNQ